jgi:hypothetical protein
MADIEGGTDKRSDPMKTRQILTGVAIAAALAVGGYSVTALAQGGPGFYGPGMMGSYGPGYGQGYGPMHGYAYEHMRGYRNDDNDSERGQGYGPSYHMRGWGDGYGPGMMGGYGYGRGMMGW